MNFKEIIQQYIRHGETDFYGLVHNLYEHEDNFNNCDKTSGQRVYHEFEIDLKLREAYQEVMALKFNWLELESRLKKHDYTYMMSDDHSIWNRGVKEEARVRKFIEEALKIDPTRTKRLIKKYKSQYGTQFEVD